MAGHSKWAQIKRKKAANDLKRGKLISKHLRAIQAAARAGGSPYPEANVQLRNAIEAARADDVPMENIERLLQKLQGGGEGAEQYEEIVYEGYAPGGVALLVYALTDNRNRTASEVRHVFSKHGGSLGTTGSVAWQFERRGVVVCENTEAAQEAAIELGALDLEEEGENLTVYTEPTEAYRIAEALKAKGVRVEAVEVVQHPQNTVALPPEEAQKVMRLVEALEDQRGDAKRHLGLLHQPGPREPPGRGLSPPARAPQHGTLAKGPGDFLPGPPCGQKSAWGGPRPPRPPHGGFGVESKTAPFAHSRKRGFS